NIGLFRPIFSPTEYIQIKGRGTRRFTFKVGHTEYEKQHFFLLDFCAVAEYFEETYDYTLPLDLPREKKPVYPPAGPSGKEMREGGEEVKVGPFPPAPEIPTWEGVDTLVSEEIRIVGPNGEKVDVMTFRGSFERDIKAFAEADPDLRDAIEAEDDDAVETLVNERFYHRPEMFYSPDKLVVSYGVPATTPAFVYNAVGRKPLPTRDAIVADTVDSIAARFNLRYSEQKWVDATAQLLDALARFDQRDAVFEALRQSTLVRQTMLAA
nr:hypothetical protein [Verrucomicrobiota bacterium]